MNHLKVVSIKPHLRRSRSHTSPSPGRPPIYSTEDAPSVQGSHQERDNIETSLTTSSTNEKTKPDQRSPRASIESQRRGRLSHLHLPTYHLHGGQGHHGEDQNKKALNSGTENTGSLPDLKATNLEKTSGQASDSKNGASQILDPFPPLNGHHPHLSRLHDPWATLSSTNQEHHHHVGLLRSRSHRSTTQLNGGKDDLLSQSNTGSRQNIGLGVTQIIPNRPRATSDSTRPTISRDLSGISVGPTASSDAIALALEKGDRKRDVKVLSSTPKDVEKLNQQATAAEEEMRRRLIQIEQEGLETARRLDYAYYGVLERVGDLSSSINQLQSLRSQVLDLGNKLEEEMNSLNEEIRSSVASLKSNAEGDGLRSRRVESLERRMQAGRDKAGSLYKRLEAARSKLRDLENQDQEWRSRIGRRIKTSWICILVALFIGFVILGINGLKQTNHTLQELGLDGILGPSARGKSTQEGQEWIEKLRRDSYDKYNLSAIDENLPLGKRISEGAYIPDEVLRLLMPDISSSSTSKDPSAAAKEGSDGGTTQEDTKEEGHDEHDDSAVLRAFDEL